MKPPLPGTKAPQQSFRKLCCYLLCSSLSSLIIKCHGERAACLLKGRKQETCRLPRPAEGLEARWPPSPPPSWLFTAFFFSTYVWPQPFPINSKPFSRRRLPKGLRGFVSNHSQISRGEPEQEQARAVCCASLRAAGRGMKAACVGTPAGLRQCCRKKGGQHGDQAHTGA